MSTPQEKLPDLSALADPAPAPVRAPSLKIEPRRKSKLRAVPPVTPPVEDVGGLPDLSELADDSPAPGAGGGNGDALPPRADLSSASASSPAPRSSRSYGAHEVFQPPDATWTIERAAPVKQFFRDTFGRDLPVSAFGQSKTHDARKLDHSHSMDVALYPQSAEGKQFTEYLKANGIPFLAYNHAVPGAATGAHIHVGNPSHGIGAGGVSSPAASSLPDLSELADAPDELDTFTDRTRFDAATPDALRRRGSREEIAQFNSSMSPQLDALGVARVEFEDNEAGRAGLPDLSAVADDEVEHADSARDSAGRTVVAPAPPQAAPTKPLDPYSPEDRARRDAAATARVRAVTLPLTRSLADYPDAPELIAAAYRHGAKSLNIPASYVEDWIKSHPGDMQLIESGTGAPHTPADLIGSPAHDERRGTVRLNLGGLSDLDRDYHAWRSTGARVADWATDDTHTAGEKFLDVAAPVAGAAGRAGDLATRPLQATSTAFWSLARKHSPGDAVQDAWTEFRTGATPDGAGNLLAEKVRASETLRNINPHLPGMVGGVVEMLTDPSNLIPLGVMARGGQFLRSMKGVRAVEEALLAGRDARFLDFYNAGGRILKIEAAPLDEVASVADDARRFTMMLKDANGAEHVIDTSAYYANGQKPKLKSIPADQEISGVGLEREGASGRVYFNGKPQDIVIDSDGMMRAAPVGGHAQLPEASAHADAVGVPVDLSSDDPFAGVTTAQDAPQPSTPLVVTLQDPHGNAHRINTQTGQLEEIVVDDPDAFISPALRLERERHAQTVAELEREIKETESVLERGTDDAGEPLTDAAIVDLQDDLHKATELREGYAHLVTVIDERGAELQQAAQQARFRQSAAAPASDTLASSEPLVGVAPAPLASPDLANLAAAADDEWRQFAPDTGTLNIPRTSMPQIKSEHRGALVQFLKGRGITHEQVEIAPNILKPSQAEFSPAKVQKARGFEGTPRSILISSDGHVLDGHHQWLSALHDAPDTPIPAIQLDAPAHQLLIETARFPSSGVDETSNVVAAAAGRAEDAALPDLSEFADDAGATEFIPVNSNPSSGRLRAAAAALSPPESVRRVASTVQDVVNITKAIPASFDASAIFNQSGIIAGAHPSLIPGAVGDGARSAMSREAFEAFKKKLVTSPNHSLREASGLDLTSLGGGEEQFASRFTQRIPGIAASERNFSATADSFRAAAFDLYADQLIKAGVTDEKAFKDIARWINVATGRGELGRLEPLAGVLTLPLFSPKLLASKFQIVSPLRYARMHPAARKIALREMFRAAGSLTVTMGLAKLAGADVDLDPFSGGFGTIDADGTSYDLSGGRLRALRFAAQLADSLNRQRRGEALKEARRPAALVEKFFRAYLSPVGALAYDYHAGEDMEGNAFGEKEWKPAEMNFGELDRLMPFAVKDMREAYKEAGAVGAAKALPAFVGVGVHTSKRRPEPIKPLLSERAQAEIDRVGLDLEHLGKKSKTSVYVRPRRTVEGITGDSIQPFGDEESNNGMGVSPEESAKKLGAELDAAILEEIDSPDYEALDDEAKARRLDLLLVNGEKRFFNGVRRDARGLQIEEEKKVKERLDRMTGGRPAATHFKL